MMDLRESRLHSRPGTQIARPDRPHLGANIGPTWAQLVNATWVIEVKSKLTHISHEVE